MWECRNAKARRPYSKGNPMTNPSGQLVASCEKAGFLGFGKSTRCEIYKDGFIVRDGSKAHGYVWTELREHLHLEARLVHQATGRQQIAKADIRLRTEDGNEYILTEKYSGLEPVADALVGLTFRPLWDRAMSELETQGKTQFGRFTLTPDRLSEEERGDVPWEDVAQVETWRLSLFIWTYNRQSTGPGDRIVLRFAPMFGELPNGFVFQELVRKFSPNIDPNFSVSHSMPADTF
jgi:hypothetical protein